MANLTQMTRPSGRSSGSSSSRSRAKKPERDLRFDIQGLRMVAVMVVVLDHLTGWPAGGFVGVDVFFVISGYLITGRLLRTASEKSAGNYFWTFYKLRFRRILPAGLLVIALTVIASYIVFNSARADDTAVDGFWAAIFMANWHFSAEATDYFAQASATSPLQHYWSLSVEEQFYVAWPFLVLAIAFLVKKLPGDHATPRNRDLSAGALIGVISVATFLLAMHDTEVNPNGAYFSTIDRTWELGVGAALAAFLPHIRSIPKVAAEVASLAGMAIIIVAVSITPSSHGFPAPWASLAVVGAAVVIAAGGLGTRVGNVFLTNPVSVFLGNTSYSIYLIHFPLIIIFAALMTEKGNAYYAVVLLGTFSLAALSYYFVEEPARGGAPHARRKEIGALAASAAVAAFAIYVVQPPAPIYTDAQIKLFNDQQDQTDTTTTTSGSSSTAVEGISKELLDALKADRWPTDLDPTIESVLSEENHESTPLVARCADPKETIDPAGCAVGSLDHTKTAVIVGDSMSRAYEVAFEELATSENPGIEGWQFVLLGSTGCTFTPPPYPGFDDNDTRTAAECAKRYKDTVAYIQQSKPDLVLATAWSSADPGGDRTTVAISSLDLGSKFVFVMPPPDIKDPGTCYSKSSAPSACVQATDSKWKDQFEGLTALSRSTGAVVVDTRKVFCYQDQCPEFAGTIPVRVDTHHATAKYAQHIAPALLELLQEAKAFPRHRVAG